MENNLEFLQDWYLSNCNGDWEHNYGIKIETLDNPGWRVAVDLEDTEWGNLDFSENAELTDDDWYNISVKQRQLIAVGDPKKLSCLLGKIRDILSSKLA